MNWEKELFIDENEKPLDRLVEGYSNTSVFRKIAFIGDSLSSGEFETVKPDGKKGYHDLYEYSWGQYIARKNGLTAYNFSKGGMRARQYMETFAEQRGFWNPELACQAYVIALGVNDFNHKVEVGSIEDVDKDDWRNNKHTFVGDMAAIVQRYKEIAPDAKFFFVTMPASSDSTRNQVRNEPHAAACYALAEFFENSYVIDLFKYGPVYDDRFKERFYLHSHMNASGYIFTAKMIDSYIDYIVRHNPDDFRNVGFVNSGIQYKF